MQKNCPKCRNSKIKLNWKNSDLKQKYKCKKCNFCFVDKDRKTPVIKTEKIFNDCLKKWYIHK